MELKELVELFRTHSELVDRLYDFGYYVATGYQEQDTGREVLRLISHLLHLLGYDEEAEIAVNPDMQFDVTTYSRVLHDRRKPNLWYYLSKFRPPRGVYFVDQGGDVASYVDSLCHLSDVVKAAKINADKRARQLGLVA